METDKKVKQGHSVAEDYDRFCDKKILQFVRAFYERFKEYPTKDEHDFDYEFSRGKNPGITISVAVPEKEVGKYIYGLQDVVRRAQLSEGNDTLGEKCVKIFSMLDASDHCRRFYALHDDICRRTPGRGKDIGKRDIIITVFHDPIKITQYCSKLYRDSTAEDVKKP